MSEIIKLHDLKPAPGSKKAKTRVGRGEGSKGKTAGRGTKGTKARKNVPVTFEGGQMPIHMRLPKLKGFRNRFRTEYGVVNVGDIAKAFPNGGTLGVDDLTLESLCTESHRISPRGGGTAGFSAAGFSAAGFSPPLSGAGSGFGSAGFSSIGQPFFLGSSFLGPA